MEPRIQHAKTEDGVSIEYRTLGEGIPLPYGMIAILCVDIEGSTALTGLGGAQAEHQLWS